VETQLSPLTQLKGRVAGLEARTQKQANQGITCHNCNRKGDYKSDCWRKGGSNEGQGPRQGKGKQLQKQAANNAATATDTQDNYAFASFASDMASRFRRHIRIPSSVQIVRNS
jgi:hypothetical protein